MFTVLLLYMLPYVKEKQINGHYYYYSLEKGMATHASILAWRIPLRDEPGGLQSTGSQRVGHN